MIEILFGETERNNVQYETILTNDKVVRMSHPSENERANHAKNTKKVAFVCVHNSCRSQMAEALGKHLAGEVFESYSAGTETRPQINQDAVRLMKARYGIDMEQTQYSKLITDLPSIDILITMGCNVACPALPCEHREDWGLDDPTGQEDAAFFKVMETIHKYILDLKERIANNTLKSSLDG